MFFVVNGTFTAESFGKALTSRGGKLSIFPPVGGRILAQEESVTTTGLTSQYKKISKGAFHVNANIEHHDA
jgi:hypothetical protein